MSVSRSFQAGTWTRGDCWVCAVSLVLFWVVGAGSGKAKSEDCPEAMSCAARCAAVTAGSMVAVIAARWFRPWTESKAPDLMSASMVDLLMTPECPPSRLALAASTRSQKSWMLVNGLPFGPRALRFSASICGSVVSSSSATGFFRSSMMAWMALAPAPLMAESPKRTWPCSASCGSPGLWTTVKSACERLISGGLTSTPTFPVRKRVVLQSSRYGTQSATFCALDS